MVVLDHGQAANARTNHHTNTVGIGFSHLQTRVLPGLNPGRHTVMNEDIHVPRLLGRHIVFDVEAFHLTRKAGREWAGIKLGDIGNAGTACQQLRPGFSNRISDRANDAQAGNNNTTAAHDEITRKEGTQAF